MKAYVLAAGYATRMHPLTRDRPKALLEVAGAPVLTHLARRLAALDGLTHIVVVTNDRFHAAFESWASGGPVPVPITVLNDGTRTNDDRLGAIGDLRFAVERVPPTGEDAVVLAADNLYGFDLGGIQRTFRERGATTLLVRSIEPGSGPSAYNEVTLGEDGQVTGFREKPSDPESEWTAVALYFFPASVLARLDEYLTVGNPDAPGHFIAWLVGRVPITAVPLDGPWFDVGSLEGLARAREAFRPIS